MTLFPEVTHELAVRELDTVVVFAGGIVPRTDVEALARLGIERVFQPGSRLPDIVAWLRDRLRATDPVDG
jgi:methylmalonyl-CoA mutase C-terminal domain/subunit